MPRARRWQPVGSVVAGPPRRRASCGQSSSCAPPTLAPDGPTAGTAREVAMAGKNRARRPRARRLAPARLLDRDEGPGRPASRVLARQHSRVRLGNQVLKPHGWSRAETERAGADGESRGARLRTPVPQVDLMLELRQHGLDVELG